MIVFLLTGLALSPCMGNSGAPQARVVFSKTIEGDFISNQDIPVNLVAGDSEHPELLKLSSVRFETAYGNAWKVMGRLQWHATENAYWRITAALMDRQGRVLRHASDDPAHIITVKGSRLAAEAFCAELELDAMHFEQRFHARRFRLCLERLAYHEQEDGERTMILSARDEETQEPLARAILQVRGFDRSAPAQRVRRLYSMDLEGRVRFSYAHSPSMSLNLQVQCPGHAVVSKGFSARETIPDKCDVQLPSAKPVAGTVLNETGQPVPGVWITLETHQRLASGYCSLNRAVKTDSQGKWGVAGMPKGAERVSVRFKHPDYRKEYTRFTGLQTDHRQILKPGLPVRGVVYDGKGKALPDAIVHMLPMSHGDYQDDYMHALTNDQGEFSFRCARDDMTDIQSEKGLALLLVESPGYLPTIKKIKAGPNTPEVDIHLAPGASLSGQVLDQQGNPVPDAWTVVHPFPEQYEDYGLRGDYTDAQGGFTFEHVPKQFLLTVGKPGFITVRRLPFPPEAGEPVVRMTPAMRLTGKVRDATTGTSVNAFELSLCSLDENGEPKQQRSQRWEPFQQGVYEKVIGESFTGKRVVMIRANGYSQGTSKSFGMDEGDQSLDFALTPDPSYQIARPQQPQKKVIKGIVLTPQKTPAANVAICIYGELASNTQSSADGRFKLVFSAVSRPFGAGPSSRRDEDCVIVARDQQNNLAAALDSFDPRKPLQLQLESAVTLLGKVVDAQGKGLPQADISLTLWHGDSGYGKGENVSIKEDGSFAITAVPRYQRYSVKMKAAGYGSDYIRVNTNDDVSEIKLDTLILNKADQSIAGQVVDQEGKPIPTIRITAYGKGQAYLRTKADQQGRFVLQGLAPGEVSIQASLDQPRRLHGRAKVQAGDQDIKIIAEERDSRGRRVAPKRKSLAGRPIPTWTAFDLSIKPEKLKNKPILVCFWDMEQRPSRYLVKQLSRTADTLATQDLQVVLVQITKVGQEKLDQWLAKNEIAFGSSTIKAEIEKLRLEWGIQSLPWLILTDHEHIIVSEGFQLGELDDWLEQMKRK